MNARSTLLIAATLLTFPLAFAHAPTGTPKNYCEDTAEWHTHDYGPPATGLAVFLLTDGNLAGDCNGDGIPADFDGHSEFALGGGWLLVDSGDGVTSGSLACYGEAGHHSAPFFVRDVVFGNTVPFRVESDFVSLVPPTDPTEPECGDFQTDESTTCVDGCTPTFPPGLDGAYIVYVGGAISGSEQLVGLTGLAGHLCDLHPIFCHPAIPPI